MWDNIQPLQENNGGVGKGEGEMDHGFTFIKKGVGNQANRAKC